MISALTGSLYAYGPRPGGRMNEHTPVAATGRKGRLRKRMWEQALAAGIRTVEVRGSDYIGKDAVGIYAILIEPAMKKGRAAWVTGHLDMPHTFTFNGDMARALVTLAQDERAWGRAWHVPPPPAVTIREFALALRAGRRQTAGETVPAAALGDACGRAGRAHRPRNGRDGLPVVRAIPHGRDGDGGHLRPGRHRPRHRHPRPGRRDQGEHADGGPRPDM
ncbi:hypothetical protein [Amycolatopsis sp. NPDC102389]|uniref:hypothetical protein n=1 Tax=Amycolatopsis sp. NPDC102389 TaxID=3363941 RepID=UPI0038291008